MYLLNNPTCTSKREERKQTERKGRRASIESAHLSMSSPMEKKLLSTTVNTNQVLNSNNSDFSTNLFAFKNKFMVNFTK